jgi:signal transduction histidine kinase
MRSLTPLGGGTEEHLFRIVLEALNNLVKHARAGRADVRLTVEDGLMRMEVGDDGVGFDPVVAHVGHLGLSTMADRARAIGAELTVTSAPGAGTTVTLLLPHHLKEAAPHAQ